MKKLLIKSMFTGAFLLAAGAAHAACTTDVAKDDLSTEQINAAWECIRDELREGYAKGGNEWAKAYPSWGAAATGPAAPGPHGNRFLMTYVNEVGFAEYVKYSDEREGNPMPVGSVLAKEVFNVNKKNQVRKGQLFFMEKVAAGTADDFGNWVYSAVKPNGDPMKVSQKFCHDCHGAFSDQDAMGYPDEDVRLASE